VTTIEDARVRASDTPARIDPPIGLWDRYVSGFRSAQRRWTEMLGRLAEMDPWKQRPESLAEQWAYVRAGDWVPGEQHPWLERAGKLYGTFALAVTALFYSGAWVCKRPMRLTYTLLAVAAFVTPWVVG
jgi:hypothetical protein